MRSISPSVMTSGGQNASVSVPIGPGDHAELQHAVAHGDGVLVRRAAPTAHTATVAPHLGQDAVGGQARAGPSARRSPDVLGPLEQALRAR